MKHFLLTCVFITFALVIPRQQLVAQNYIYHWIAGNGIVGFDRDSVAAITAEIATPEGLVTDPSGNLYFADQDASRIRMVNTNGIIYTIAGTGVGGYSGDGGPATAAEIGGPQGVIMDTKGNLYFADGADARIRKINSNGIISTLAGRGFYGFSGDGGPATAADLSWPVGIALDKYGNLFFADRSNNRVREIDTNGIITTVIGNGTGSYSGDGGPASAAEMYNPVWVVFDTSGNLFISDESNLRIREVNTSGIISTIAGNGVNSYNGDGGPATAAAISQPTGLAFDAQENLYVCNAFNCHVRKINTSGIISTVVGSSNNPGFGGDGGPATAAYISYANGITFDGNGNYYLADAIYNHRIRKVNTSGIITTIAGDGNYTYSGDGGPATNAQIYLPTGISSDNAGNVYIADEWNQRIRKVNTSGIISTFAGIGMPGFSGDGGPATSAELENAAGVSVNTAGNVYIADFSNYRIRRVTGSGTISTVAGNGIGGFSGDGGPATAAEIYGPWEVASDGAGNIYISDQVNYRIRKVNAFGTISTIAGNGTSGYSGDGGQATAAEISTPMQVAVDGAGNIYIADEYNNRVRKINASGIISTIAGIGVLGYSGDGGPATAAEIGRPSGIVVDPAGNIYIGDNIYPMIRKINTSGIITTIAGGGSYFCVQGVPALWAHIGQAVALSLDGAGNLYSVDESYNRVYKFTPTPTLTVSASQKNIKCFGSCNGSAWAIVSGGLPPYTYNWTPSGGTMDTAVNLCAGTYTCTVKDAAANTATVSVTITQPPQLRDSISSQTNIACYGLCNGSLTVGVKGGTSAYTYLWTPGGQTTASITGLCAGCYTVTVTDANSCSVTASSCITQPPQLIDSICMVRNVTCNGGNDGCLGACVSGGTPPYTYNWTPVGGTSDSICNLTAGCYTVTVVDADGCIATATNCVTQPAVLTATVSASPDTICVGGCTTITVNPSGGNTPYNYLWSNAMTTSSISVCPTVNTTYSVQVTGGACVFDTSITILVEICAGVPGINPANDGLLLYPNPSNGVFTLELSVISHQSSVIEIYNMLGEKALTLPLSQAGEGTQIDMSKQPAGIYLYRVLTETGNLASEGKFVIQK